MSLTLNTQHILWILLAGVAVTIFIFWAYRQLMVQLSSRTGWGLTLVRIAAVGMLLFTICEPAASIVLKRSEQGTVLLFIDTSDSMGITDRVGNRLEEVSGLLTGSWFTALADRYSISTYQFSERVTPISESAFDSLKTQTAGTNISAALEFARTRSQRIEIAGIILVTDGNHTVGRDPQRTADGLTIPVYTIGMGDTLEVKDTAVISHVTNEVAYVDSRIPVEITIQSRGYEGEKVPVVLQEDGRTIDSREVVLAGGGREQSVTLHLAPSLAGVRQYTVSLQARDDELVSRNNQRSFSIKVLKSKLNVLYIEGSPRTDMTFLKQTLKRDPNVRLTSVIFRPDGQFYPEPLPDSRSEWLEYDLVILGSIAHGQVQPWSAHIVNLVERQGGGLIVLGGPKSFELGGYAGTPLGNLMPVQIPRVNRGLLEGLYLPTLTADGETHPLTQLHDDPLESARRWSELPPLTGINQVGPAKPGATVLVVHPTWQVNGQDTPVISVHRYGHGKVLAVATYDIWRWDLMMWGAGGTNASYARIWSNAVRWLTTREGGKRVRVATGKSTYSSGESVVFSGQVYDDTFRPIDHVNLSLTIIPKMDETRQFTVGMTSSSAGSGRYESAIRHLMAGEYTFTARATRSGQVLGTDIGGFEIGESAVEFTQTSMDKALLSGLAGRTGGGFYRSNDAERLISEITVPDKTVTGRSDVHIWNHPVSLILFILALSIEWFIRRRHGLM
ncbi:MAG: hypothetical protein VYA69_00520 [Gemmatimonadota bacterium]|nr:hypothetical protein [Gemmatimonadota bacterium]